MIQCWKKAKSLGLNGRVKFMGYVPREDLPALFRGATAFVYPSLLEGFGLPIVEAMACGTPVVASNVWGTPEVVATPEAGVLMAERTPEALAGAVRQLFANYPDHAATRRYAERFSWDDTTRGQVKLFQRILAAEGARWT
jgi:glycosyltransferase involved in cell wall biosynthesis